MTPAALAPPTRVSACPSCGRPMRRPRQAHARATVPASTDTSQMSETDLYRYYHRTAPVEDLRFFLRVARLSPGLRANGEALLAIGCRDTGGALTRSDWYRRLTALQDRWRRETADASRPDVPALMAEAV
jgi:hypothetical protein